MDVEKVNKITLPEGDRGSFLFTRAMVNEFGLDILEDLITAKSVKLGVNLAMQVSEERQGFRISWRPA